jgi:TonB-linked SusC/RagA family outer membrane protein
MRSWSSARAAALLASLVALAGAPTAATAQGSATVQGTVTDSVGRRPIAGVQVVIAGTTRGTLSDEAGRYTIRSVPAGQVTVRAQRLGFAAAEQQLSVAAGETATADFMMRAVATVLSEVVVTGYGTASRAEVSSAVTQVSGDAVRGMPIAGVDAALQGKAPGVQVVQNAGNPGNGITVRVRGSSSISAGNQPLYVVDGVPMQREDLSQFDLGGQNLNAVTGLSPDEIESIDILKDAAAAAIYGSRGANGVIQITTKRGRPGRTRFSFNAYYGSQTNAKKLDLLSGPEYVEFMNEAAVNGGDDAPFTPGVDDQINTDWQDVLTRTAPVTDLNLSVMGGSERISYLLSGSLFDQTGIVIGSDYDRVNGRFNVDFTATSRLAFRSSIGLARERWHRVESDDTIEGPSANAVAVQPNIAPRRPDGSFTTSDEGIEYANPLALALLNTAPATAYRLLGGVDAMWDITDRLRLTGRVGADIYDMNERRWESGLAPDTYSAGVRGVGRHATNNSTRYLTEGYFTFDPVRHVAQRLTLTAGAGLEYNREERTYLRGENFPSDFFRYVGSAGRIVDYDGDASGHNLQSFFARANYSLLDRYLVTASFRADGSSRFGTNNRWGFFPAASVGWVATDEPFLSGLKRFADVKLRASYGVTGNQGITNNFAYLGYYGKANFAGDPGLAPENFANSDLRWETTTETDVGFDVSFLSGRVALIGDYYHKETSDLIIQRPVSSTSGYTDVWQNVGSLQNTGFELQLSSTNFQAQVPGEFEWRTDFNISHNKNKVLKLFRGEPFNSGHYSINRVEEGQPLGAFHAEKFLGVDPETGDAIFFDKNGDGQITPEDRVIVGSPHPDYWGGIRNQLSWKGFDLNTFLEFSQGAEVFNAIRLFADDGGYNFDNKLGIVRRRWRQPGDITDVPKANWWGETFAYGYNGRYVEDGSYIRLQEVTLGYRLPQRIAARANFADARVYVSGRNLKLWTDYLGFDPDVNSSGSSANVSLGTDFYAYPRARTITFGISGNW